MRKYVSYSELSSFALGCQWRWKTEYLDNNRTTSYSIHFDFGTAIHESLEKFLTRNNPVSVSEAVELFKNSLNEAVKNNSDKYTNKKYDLDQLLLSGERIISNIMSDCAELRESEFIHNELLLFEKIDRDDDLDVSFKGYVDLVIKSKDKRNNAILYVCDFKTCSFGWKREKRADRWTQYQLFLYKHFLCKKFDIDPKGVRTAFILLKKSPPPESSPIEFVPVSAGPVSVQRALDALGSAITEMHARESDMSYKKNRSMCKDNYGNTCPFFNTEFCT